MGNGTVLIVEDEADAREALSEILEIEGFELRLHPTVQRRGNIYKILPTLFNYPGYDDARYGRMAIPRLTTSGSLVSQDPGGRSERVQFLFCCRFASDGGNTKTARRRYSFAGRRGQLLLMVSSKTEATDAEAEFSASSRSTGSFRP